MPLAMRKRYWVYVHDKDGDLLEDLGEFDGIDRAIDQVAQYLSDPMPAWDMTEITVRIVDNELQDGTTIWKAGPHDWKKEV